MNSSHMDEKWRLQQEERKKIQIVNLKILKKISKNSYWVKILTALYYAVSSFLFTVVNKIVLTSCGFPSPLLLALLHLILTSGTLSILKNQGRINYPNYNKNLFKKIFPLPILFLGNVVTSLDGTKELSLPMFTALRRFAILLTMFFEYIILNVRPKFTVQLAVYTMIGGSMLAAVNDSTFHLSGYVIIMLNNLCAASTKVITKQKLETEEFGSCGLLYYNSLFMIFPLTLCSYLSNDLEKAWNYQSWSDSYFLLNFVLSCLLAFPVNLSIILCTSYNSALTTATVGCFKDILVTQAGMIVGGDYVYSFYNWLGLNAGAGGSLLYIFVTFRKSSQPETRLPVSGPKKKVGKKNTQVSRWI